MWPSQFRPRMTAYGGTIVVAANQTGGIPTTAVSGTGTSTPIAVTLAATLVTATGATLNGGVNPSGSATTARFDYGLTLGYGTQVSASPAPGSGTSLVAVSAAINGLLPNTPYHFRVVATGGASVNGSDQIFMTILERLFAFVVFHVGHHQLVPEDEQRRCHQ